MTTATLSRIFNAVNTPHYGMVDRHLPMINSITSSLGSYLSNINQISKKRNLMRWYKLIPELTAIANKVAKDIVYKYHFETINPKESGRNKVQLVNKFAQKVGLRKVMLSQIIDQLVTGDGFGWMGKIDDKTVKEMINDILKNKEPFMEKKETKSIQESLFKELKAVEGFVDETGVDEDLLRPRKYRYVPSTTVEVIHNDFDIIQYNHKVGLKTVEFKPKEMIHFTLMDVDGKVNGFSPVESVIVQLELLRQMWQNMSSIHKNGGSPDKIFTLENIQPNSPAYKRIEQQLDKYKVVENKHGNMLFTGKVNIHELNQLDKMQFMDSGLYITGLIAMQWQVPRSSIPYIVGGANTKDDTGGNSEKGYWRNIEISQDTFAETMNTQLWMPHFGVKIVFDNTFIQQDVQLHTANQLRFNNILTMDQILSPGDKQLDMDKRMELLGLTPEDLEKKKEEILPGAAEGMGNQLSKSDVNDSQSKKNIKDKKRSEQQSTISSQGMKPTGIGKEWDASATNEFKQMIGSSEELINLQTFVKLYNEDRALSPGKPPRLFMRVSELFTTFKFKSTDFVYKVSVPNAEIEQDRILLMNLGSNIYRL